MTLDTHQHTPVDYLAHRKRGLVVSPAGSGKTVIAAAALARVLAAKARTRRVAVGWVANTKEQCEQAEKALAMFPEVARLADVWVRCAAAGTDWSGCDLLIVDECHHAQAPEWSRQIEACTGARWGLTATPDFEGDDAQWKTAKLRELFGFDWHVVPRAAVARRVTKAEVVILDPQWEPELANMIDAETEKLYRARIRHWGGDPAKLRAMVWWQKCVEVGIVKNANRTVVAVGKAAQHIRAGDSVLVLVNQVEYAQEVAKLIGFGAVACYSGMGAKARRHALYWFKEGKVPCLVATSLADEGLDVPRANVLVLVSGGKNKAKAEQRSGRVLRQFAGKEKGLIYDFADSAHPLMRKHAESRQQKYFELGYSIKRI